MRIVTGILSLLASTLCIAQASWHFTAGEVMSLHSTRADAHIMYGLDPLQFGDLRLPQGHKPYPVVILIHGACWLSHISDSSYTAPLADALRNAGYATWNIEYRGEDVAGGGYPETFLDIGYATDYLTKIAKQYSLDLNHVVVIGQSAGGQLALWDASRNRLSKNSPLYIVKPLKLRGVIAMGGIPDLKAYRERGKEICGDDVIGKLLGDSKSEIASHSRDISPMNLVQVKTPIVLIYGNDDITVPVKFGMSYYKMIKQNGGNITLLQLPSAAHHEYTVPNSVVWPVLLEQLKILNGQGNAIKKPNKTKSQENIRHRHTR